MRNISPDQHEVYPWRRSSELRRPDVTLFIPDLTGGGAERVMVNLARGMSERGLAVDLLLVDANGPYLSLVPERVKIIELGTRKTSLSLPALRGYMRSSGTPVLISALHHANLAALFAKRLFKLPTRIVPSIHNTISVERERRRTMKQRIQHALISRCYRWADGLVAVSEAVAGDLAETMGLPRNSIASIYNPVVTPDIFRLAQEQPEHPWLTDGSTPVVLGIGRLDAQKDFATLIHAFENVQSRRSARLIIFGEGDRRRELEQLVATRELGDVVSLPGFVDNPYAALRHASVFALSSRWEGLPTVLIEALALGVPAVSTDCPSGPHEILSGGAHGDLVPVGDSKALADAIVRALDEPRDATDQSVWQRYSLDTAVDAYLRYTGVEACE